MKYAVLIALCCFGSLLQAQNNNPTIAPCDGMQTVCATGPTYNVCVNIVLDQSYANLSKITSYEIKWGDDSPSTIIQTNGGQAQPPQYHTFDLADFYNTCQEKKEFYITLLTNHTPNTIQQTNSIFILTILNPPIAGIVLADAVLCTGESVALADSSCPAGFWNSNWSFGDGTNLENSIQTTHTYNMQGTYIVTHSITNSCGSDTTTKIVSVFDAAVADVKVDSGALNGNSGVICLGGGGIVKLNAGASQNGVFYTWTVTPATGWEWWPPSMPPPTPAPTGPQPSIHFLEPGTYTIKVRVNNLCNSPSEKTIEIKAVQAPLLNLAPQPDDCQVLMYTPSPLVPGAKYKINGVETSTFPVSLPISANPYAIEATLTNECGAQTQRDTFNLFTAQDVAITAPDSLLTVCTGSAPIVLSAAPTGGTWSGQFISQAAGNTIFTPTTPGLYVLKYTRGGGICLRTDQVSIKVEQLYNLQLTPQPDECDFVNYTPLPKDPNVQYTINGVPQTSFPVTLQVSNTPYIIGAAATNVCGTRTLADTFAILSATPVQITAPKDTLVCQNSGVLTLAAEPAGGTWQGQNVSGSVFNPAAGGIFPVIYIRGTGNCERRDTARIEVVSVNIEAGNDVSKCVSDQAFILNSPTPAASGVWIGPGVNSAGNFDPAVAGVGNFVLNYQITDTVLGCSFRDSLVVAVHPLPQSDFEPPLNTCIGTEIQFKNLSQSAFASEWDFGDGKTSGLEAPTHTYSDTGTFTVKLRVTTEFGCSDEKTRTVFVTRPPNAFFTPSANEGCAPLSVSFQNESNGYQAQYAWKIGNLPIDTAFTPAPLLLPGGSKDTFYIVTLTAKNLCAEKTWTDSILVRPLPIVVFGTATDTICTGGKIVFANTSAGLPTAFFWDFGNGQTSTDSIPQPMEYSTDTLFKTYTIRLIATNVCGADTLEHDITVRPVEVRAFFNVPNLSGCQPYTAQFTSFATPGALISWDFGDGNTSGTKNPQHTFQMPGTYLVVQKAADGCGFDSTSALITVHPAPKVSFDFKAQFCLNDTLQFNNTSPDVLSGIVWDFGDGDSSFLYSPSHVYDSIGTKMVVLTGVSAAHGCKTTISSPVTILPLPDVRFSFDTPDGCVPLTVKFQNQSNAPSYFAWNFGDGNTLSGPAPTHTYLQAGQFEVKLTGIDQLGCRNDTILRYITVHPKPNPDFEMQKESLCGLPTVVQFDNNSTDAIEYQWTFGDSSGSTPLNNPQHSYTAAGDYTVRLTALNAFGCRDTTEKMLSAYAQPVADFSWDPEKGCAPLTVNFENLSTNNTDATWIFSDGGQSVSVPATTHTFYNAGKFGATLIVSHRQVCFDTLTLPNIIEVYPRPSANFSFLEIPTDPPSGQFAFTDLSQDAVRWLWTFGDGDTSEVQNPTHRYYSNGVKWLKLTVFGKNGCPNDTILPIYPEAMHHIFIPNAFTPGLENGEAALFQPKGVGLREFNVAVYSSYGQLLWSSDSDALQNGQPGKGWDGRYKGVLMPQDVYTWEVKRAIFEDGTSWGGKRVGSVTLIR